MINFFNKVLPSNAPVYLLAYPSDDGKTMKHIVTHSKDELISSAHTKLDKDLYFAVSGYSQGWHKNPYNPDKNSLRTQRNSCSQRALWLDIDVGEDKDYASQVEAVQALEQFCISLGVPYPIIVSSGRGLHVYWALDRDVSTEEWRDVALRLKEATVVLGLRVDQSRTADSASVLRVPGSYNMKDPSNPKLVRVVYDGSIVSFDMMKQALGRFDIPKHTNNDFPQFVIPEYILEAIKLVEDDFSWLIDRNSVDLNLIIQNCKQIRECGTSTRQAWIGAFTILCHGANGRELAHELSSIDPRYSPEVTDREFDDMSSGQFGPMRCDTFAGIEPTKCAGCPFYKKITSPISLGKKNVKQEPELVEVDSEGNVVDSEEHQAIANTINLPVGHIRLEDFGRFIHRGEGVVYQHPPKKDTPAYEEVLFQKLPKPLYILVEIENKIQSIYYMWEMERNNMKQVVKLAHTEISSQMKTLSWLASVMMFPSPSLHRQAYEYMSVYIKELQTKLPTITKQERFGWGEGVHTDGSKIPTFVLGEYIYTPGNTPSEVEFDGAMLEYARHNLGWQGTVEGWKQAVSAYSNGDVWAQFGICLGFGAPLMKLFNNSAKNGIVNFYSSESGTGKSTLQTAIASIWGHPVDQLITVSTHNARLELMGMRKNLPMIMDEITGIEGKELSELIFNMANGSGKLRLNQDSSLKTVKRWETISITSANNTLLDRLLAMSSSREGEQMRALDVYVPKATQTREEFDEKFSGVMANYGVVGREFIQAIIDNERLYKALPDMLQAKATDISNKASHRFWANTVAAAVVAGIIAKKLGLIDFDIEEIERYARDVISKQGNTLNSSKQTPHAIVSDFISDMRPNTVVVKEAERNRAEDPEPALPRGPDKYVISLPTQNAIHVRYELEGNVAYVSTKAFKDWLKEGNHSMASVIETLERDGILKNVKRVYLNKDVPSIPSVRVSCYRIKLDKCNVELDLNGVNNEED